jgi:hypothetical protein
MMSQKMSTLTLYVMAKRQLNRRTALAAIPELAVARFLPRNPCPGKTLEKLVPRAAKKTLPPIKPPVAEPGGQPLIQYARAQITPKGIR